jgi:N-acetylglucosamine kinase-like BadF-type ATPase
MLVKLSNLFGISLDELIFEKTSHHYFLGIDGGGTKTVFKLTDENGAIVHTVLKGSVNPNDIGMENALSLLKEGIHEVCREIPYSSITMFAGISGGGLSGNNAEIFRQFFRKFGFFAFENGSDIENLVALSDYEKYILVIMGTGFIVYALDGARRKRIAGWGQFFDDGGSGYTLGKGVISAVLSAGDGSGKQTLLTDLLEEQLGESAEAHLTKFYGGGKRYIAELAGLAFQGYEKRDPVAIEILEKDMAFVANKIDTALSDLKNPDTDESIPVLFSGGISKKNDILFPLIQKHMKRNDCTLSQIKNEPVDGALRRAKKIFEEKRKVNNIHEKSDRR